MTNRTNKKLEEFKELIDRDWQLSLEEDEFLDSVLNLLLSRETKKAAEIVNFFYSEEWENLLELIPDRQIRYYAERDLNMIDEDDCDCEEQLTLEDFDNEELIAEIYDRGYTTFYQHTSKSNIITDMNLSEMNELFLSLLPQKQLEIIKLLQNEI
ncbi:MAG: hypothetical protein WBP57_11015 [Ignavibacteria bacterium]